MTPLLWIAGPALVLCALALGVQLRRRLADRDPEYLWGATLLPPALTLTFSTYLGNLLGLLYFDWDGARLALSAALARGIDIYTPAGEGPILGNIYGPISALFYLPAVLGRSATASLLIAGVMTVAIVLGPLFWINLKGNWEDPRRRLPALMGFAFCAASVLAIVATESISTRIRVDAVAVGLGLLSCIVLIHNREQPGWPRLALASAIASLAVWSKQIEAPLLVAHGLYLWLAFGRKMLWRFLSAAFCTGSVISVTLILTFGSDMLFNMFVVPFHQPSIAGISGLLWASLDLLRKSALLLLLVAWTQMCRPRRRDLGRPPLQQWMRENPWTLPFLVALCMVPTSVVGRNIVGGADNSYHTIYYLIAAASLCMLGSAFKAEREPERKVPDPLLFALLAALACQPLGGLKYFQHLSRIPSNPQEQAYDFMRAHPQQAYFPWYPLAGLLAEGRLYHFDDGVIRRWVAGYPPSLSHFRAHVPADLRFVAYRRRDLGRPDHAGDEKLRRAYLSEYSRKIEVDELPGWIVYVEQRR